MTKEYLEENSIVQITSDAYSLYHLPTNKKNITEIVIYSAGITKNLGYIVNDENQNIYQNIIINNEAICFFKIENGIKSIEKLFYITTFVFIKESQENLEKIFSLLYGYNFNEEKNNHLTRKLKLA